MLRDNSGNRLFRKITIRVTFPDAIFPPKLFVQHAGPRQGFGPEGIDATLDSIATQLDTLYPFWEFKPIELSPEGRTGRFAFVFAGYRATPSTQPQESSVLAVGAEREDLTPTEVGTTPAVPDAPVASPMRVMSAVESEIRRESQSPDPVHQNGGTGKWYFWDEKWSDVTGPFDTEGDARSQLKRYAEAL